jgi:Fe-S oxidoreductase
MALALLEGHIGVDHHLAQIVSACTTCGLCDVSCKFIMAAERQNVIITLKEHIVESNFATPPKAADKPTLPVTGRTTRLAEFPPGASSTKVLPLKRVICYKLHYRVGDLIRKL